MRRKSICKYAMYGGKYVCMYADVELSLGGDDDDDGGGTVGNYSGFRGCHWHYHPTIGDSVAEASRYCEARLVAGFLAARNWEAQKRNSEKEMDEQRR